MNFKEGDRVIVNGEFQGKRFDNHVGTVKYVNRRNDLGICFDKNIGGHNLGSAPVSKHCKSGHGYWVCEDIVSILEKTPGEYFKEFVTSSSVRVRQNGRLFFLVRKNNAKTLAIYDYKSKKIIKEDVIGKYEERYYWQFRNGIEAYEKEYSK